MKHYGDICKINGAEVPPVEVVIGGSPCQDLSVAGKRAGLEGERSGLFMEQIRLIKEMRENDRRNGRTDDSIRPRFMVWENVPGTFSSNKGEDFRVVLEETARIADENAVIPRPPQGKWTTAGTIVGDGWSIAWRVLDAQFWGVPQRRRRIALVADFGGLTAPKTLFERESVSRDTEQSRETGQGVTADTQRSTDTAISFQERAGCDGGVKEYSFSETEQEHSQLSTTSVCYGISAYESNSMKSDNPHSGIYEAETARTLDGNGGSPACNQGGMAIVAFAQNQRDEVRDLNDKAGSLAAKPGMKQQTYVAYGFKSRESAKARSMGFEKEKSATLSAYSLDESICIEMTSTKNTIIEDGVCPTLTARMGTGGNQVNAVYSIDRAAYNQGINAKYNIGIDDDGKSQTLVAKGPNAVCTANHGGFMTNVTANIANSLQATDYKDPALVYPQQSVVRRLTPLECERLQGYPDGWTHIGDWTDSKGKKHKDADSPKYKALGNSIALPPWTYVLTKLNAYCKEHTMASLFDGIGGFPLIWERLNGKGSAVWCSEIEEFPIAVTKLRFK